MEFLKELVNKWQADEISRRAAALAFYAFLSLAPLLMIVVSILGIAYGRTSAEAGLLDQARRAVGPTATSALKTILDNAGNHTAGVVGLVLGWFLLILGASGVLSELQTDLNRIWTVGKEGRGGWLGIAMNRGLTLACLLGVGLLLLAGVFASAVVAGFSHRLGGYLPAPGVLLQIGEFLVFFVIVAPLIAVLFVVLPNVTLRLWEVWVGAILTAFLFSLGKPALGVYLGRSSTPSSFGAAPPTGCARATGSVRSVWRLLG